MLCKNIVQTCRCNAETDKAKLSLKLQIDAVLSTQARDGRHLSVLASQVGDYSFSFSF